VQASERWFDRVAGVSLRIYAGRYQDQVLV
jgi:hypothetical protein